MKEDELFHGRAIDEKRRQPGTRREGYQRPGHRAKGIRVPETTLLYESRSVPCGIWLAR